MLDKTSQKFLDYLNHKENNSLHFIREDLPSGFGDRGTLVDMIRFLEEQGYVERKMDNSNEVTIGVTLTYMGRRWREFRWMEIRKYVEDNWIDFFALLISAAALGFSIYTWWQLSHC